MKSSVSQTRETGKRQRLEQGPSTGFWSVDSYENTGPLSICHIEFPAFSCFVETHAMGTESCRSPRVDAPKTAWAGGGVPGQAATKMWLATSLGSSMASAYPSICMATYAPLRQNEPVDPGKMPA